MRFNIPQTLAETELKTIYENFKINLKSLEVEQDNPFTNDLTFHYNSTPTIEFTTDEKSTETLIYIMQNYANHIGSQPALYFEMDTDSHNFYQGIITNINTNYDICEKLFTIKFSRFSTVCDACAG